MPTATRSCGSPQNFRKWIWLNQGDRLGYPLPALRCIAIDAEARLTPLVPPRGQQPIWMQRLIGVVANVIFKLKQPGPQCGPHCTRGSRNATLVIGELNDLTHIGVSMKADLRMPPMTRVSTGFIRLGPRDSRA